MVLLDVSIVNVALKSITDGLGASGSQIQWVLSGYALTFGLLLVPAGRWGDVLGRRKMFMIGLVAFTLASLACGAAPTATVLVIARLVQGLAGGMITPQVSALIQQMFRGAERGKAFGLLGAVVGISTALGPVIGGVLIQVFGETDGWRWVFLVNLPIGIAALPLAMKLIPGREGGPAGRRDYDPVGVLLLGLGVVALLLPFVQERQWTGSTKWLLLPLAAALLVVFILWERRYLAHGKEPLVDLKLFRLRSFSFGSSMIAAYFAGFTPLFFLITLLLQFGEGYSALMAGLVTMPFAIASGVAAAFAGRVVHRFGRPLVGVGLVGVVVGYLGILLTVHLVPGTGIGWALLPSLIVAGLGSGLVISPNQTITLSQVPVEQGGTAGGLLQVGQRIGAAVGIAAVGSIFYAQLDDSRGDYPPALQGGLLVAIGFLVVALAVAVLDIVIQKRRTGTHAASLGG
ncbi:MFS transporter [Nakamurella flavida]|uniref:MFS transporter n=2 Tax=Nakamurella flavida TaxID=363630 RepID=A0A938YNW0_9ACTN|nr:MFS transporter [Nakamurella flavida]